MVGAAGAVVGTFIAPGIGTIAGFVVGAGGVELLLMAASRYQDGSNPMEIPGAVSPAEISHFGQEGRSQFRLSTPNYMEPIDY